MNLYELTVVIDGKSTPAKKKTVGEKVENLVKTNKGNIVKSDDWGSKELAYMIGKSDTGSFMYYELELESEGARTIPNKLKLEDDVIRYLLVRKDSASA